LGAGREPLIGDDAVPHPKAHEALGGAAAGRGARHTIDVEPRQRDGGAAEAAKEVAAREARGPHGPVLPCTRADASGPATAAGSAVRRPPCACNWAAICWMRGRSPSTSKRPKPKRNHCLARQASTSRLPASLPASSTAPSNLPATSLTDRLPVASTG